MMMLSLLVGFMLIIAASATGAWTSDELPGRPSQVLNAPEANTLTGFGAALVLNGIGVAGTGYYLQRRYNRDSAKRYASRKVGRLPLFLDAAVSVAVLLLVSPVLMAIAATGAVITGAPKVYGCAKLATATTGKEISGTEAV